VVRRTIVGAHYGTRDWLVQRMSAVVIALFTLVVAGVLLFSPAMDYAAWKALFAHPAFRILAFLTMVGLLLHAWVGMRDILMDYVRPTGARLVLEVVVIALLVVYLGWSIHILWGLA
jgi:succinate dehydrogenase / fumarate reductase membrane anchor subunit